MPTTLARSILPKGLKNRISFHPTFVSRRKRFVQCHAPACHSLSAQKLKNCISATSHSVTIAPFSFQHSTPMRPHRSNNMHHGTNHSIQFGGTPHRNANDCTNNNYTTHSISFAFAPNRRPKTLVTYQQTSVKFTEIQKPHHSQFEPGFHIHHNHVF